MKKYDFINKELLIREYGREEKSMKQIAINLKCGVATIYNRLRNYNIKTRTKSEALKEKYRGKDTSGYIDGRTLEKHYCLSCLKKGIKKEIDYRAKKCKACSRKGRNNPSYKDGRTLEKHYCIDCEKIVRSYTAKRCKKCNYVYIVKMGLRKGKLHPQYIDGRRYDEYPEEFNEKLKEQIRKRDNYICQKCGIEQLELRGFHKKLDIHHIDYNKFNYGKNNLISLCHKCNCKANFNRDYWFAYFIYLMKEKNWGNSRERIRKYQIV